LTTFLGVTCGLYSVLYLVSLNTDTKYKVAG